jgi:hypothetical protein
VNYRIGRTRRIEAVPKAGVADPRERSALELAGAIGNGAMQQIARSPALRRSPAAAALVAGRPAATLARRPYEGDEIPEGLGVPDTMEEWLWQQQGMWEETYRREEELIKYLENRRWEDDEEVEMLEDEETRRRLGLVHPPIESGLRY